MLSDVNSGLEAIGSMRRGPRLVFPWSKRSRRNLSKLRGWARLREIARNGPHGTLRAGDMLSVASVTHVPLADSEFETDQDAGFYRVRYRVEHADGRVERVHGHSVYVHRDSHWAVRTSSSGILGGLDKSAVRRRLAELLGPDDIDESGRPTEDCEKYAANCHDALSSVDTLEESNSEFGRKRRDQALIEAGFYLAKAEAERWLAPYAERGLASVVGGTKGGRKSGETRRAWIADNWEPHALDIARAHTRQTAKRSASQI